MPLDLNATIVRNPELLHAAAGEELVMMSVDAGLYYGLDPIGRRVWELLGEETTVAAVCARLCGEYDVSPQDCARDVLALLDEMKRHGVVHAL